MDWTTLTSTKGTVGSISDWTNDARIATSASIIVQEAESEIYRRLRHWRMISAPTTGTITSGQDYLTFPSDFLEAKTLWITGTNQSELIQKTEEDVLRAWSYDGSGVRVQQQPAIYYVDSAAFRFDSVADQSYPYALTYYAQPAALSASNTTNWVTQYYPRMLRSAIMLLSAEWLKDAGQDGMNVQYWAQMLANQISTAQQESDRSRRATLAGAVFAGEYNGRVNF